MERSSVGYRRVDESLCQYISGLRWRWVCTYSVHRRLYGLGFPGYVDNAEDCDDTDPLVSPSSEIWYDGIDQDCDGQSDYDADDDGYDSIAFGGLDCDDTTDVVSPSATEVWYDGVDRAVMVYPTIRMEMGLSPTNMVALIA